jgi:hypothetical protein
MRGLSVRKGVYLLRISNPKGINLANEKIVKR